MWIDLVNDTTWAYSGQLADWTNFGQDEPGDIPEVDTVLNWDYGVWYDMTSHPHDLFAYVCERDTL